jgi:Pvc16 N-terminal domain
MLHLMISEVDSALAALVRRDVLDSAQVPVVLDPPTTEWAGRRSGPAVNLFLYDIREDVRRRGSGMYATYDDNGRQTSRREAPRVFRLSYLVTAWTQRPEDEHRLLAGVLACLLGYTRLPAELLPEGAPAVTLTVGLPPGEDRSFADVWSALGGELRPSIDLVVSVPMPAGRAEPVDKLVLEPLYADVERLADPPATERVGGPRRRTETHGRRRR